MFNLFPITFICEANYIKKVVSSIPKLGSYFLWDMQETLFSCLYHLVRRSPFMYFQPFEIAFTEFICFIVEDICTHGAVYSVKIRSA